MSALRRLPLTIVLFATFWAPSLQAGSDTVRGDWLEPSGAIIRVAPCEHGLCVQIVSLPPGRHADSDAHNPNASLRDRPLCGLRIGEGFIERDPHYADGGHIYDPKSGRTYRGSMKADGDLLELRGYVGLRLFGRTETWTRARRTPGPCRAK